MVYALIWNLVNLAGVPEEDITFYDCIFYHGDPVYNFCHADFPGVRWAEGDATDRSGYESGPGSNPGTREKVVPDHSCVVYYSDSTMVHGSGEVCFPTVVSEAKYIMSFSLPRAHPDDRYLLFRPAEISKLHRFSSSRFSSSRETAAPALPRRLHDEISVSFTGRCCS